MGIWETLRNWILGFDYIDKESFDSKIDNLTVEFSKAMDKVKENIDVDKNGMVSVGETYTLVKTTCKMILKMIKSWF